MAIIIGRKKEQEELQRLYVSNESKLVAVYGRRRVGKTYLVRETFNNNFAFYHTGLSPLELEGDNLLHAQLEAFTNSLRRYGKTVRRQPKTWIAAFELLIELINEKPKDERQLIFIDEMPWMDTPKSGFITAFEHFWNGWASGQHQVMLVVCGSAASWIMDNMINSPGGLYDRVDLQIEISPLSFEEMSHSEPGESSAVIRERVVRARQIQEQRFASVAGVHCNAQMTPKLMQQFALLDDASLEMLREAMNRLQLSARAYDRILRVARTIADLEGSENILSNHLSEAIGYRNLDRSDWAER